MSHTMILFVVSLLASTFAFASPEADAIKKMQGCYKVNFDFVETEKTDPNYPISSKPYSEYGYEWIEVDMDSQDEIHLQHVLVTPHGPLKHWRQEWKKSPEKMMSYKGDNYWETGMVAKPTENLWLQRVLQVDDSPRYECAAVWNITAEDASWYCKAWSPLPRREFSQRSDYNVLDRGNFVVVGTNGWIHHQYNDKVSVVKGESKILAKEKGANTYTKISDETCAPAKKWWSENKKVWNDIQAMWRHLVDHHPNLKLKSKVDDKTLWMHLFELADVYAQKTSYDSKELKKEVKAVIYKFMEKV